MNFMKQKMLYAIVVIVVIAIAIAGWYYYSSLGQFSYYQPKCPNWKCTQIIQTSTCPNGTANYSCSPSGFLTCYVCSTNYITKNYNVTLSAVANKTVNINGTNVTVPAYIYYINGQFTGLAMGESTTLSDGTKFGVTSSIAFYLQSQYETKAGSVTLPLPSTTTVNLIVSQSQNCVPTSQACPGYSKASCSGSTQTCTATSYICGGDQPVGCMQSGYCSACPV